MLQRLNTNRFELFFFKNVRHNRSHAARRRHTYQHNIFESLDERSCSVGGATMRENASGVCNQQVDVRLVLADFLGASCEHGTQRLVRVATRRSIRHQARRRVLEQILAVRTCAHSARTGEWETTRATKNSVAFSINREPPANENTKRELTPTNQPRKLFLTATTTHRKGYAYRFVK